jgi:uncharacterized protein
MTRLFIAATVAIVLSGSATLAQEKQETPGSRTGTPKPQTIVGPGGFEMTTYYVGFLYKGPKWSPEQTPEVKTIQEGHMANIRRMGEAGKLLIAGPFTDDGDLRGLYVFRADSTEEARALVESDPAVKAGRFRFELHPWFAAKNVVVTARAASSQ